MKQIRNIAHYIVGFVFLYTIGNATYVSDFLEWQKIVGSILIGLIFGGTIGAFWELFNNIAFGIQHDEKDVKRTAIGGVFGCMLACFYTIYLLLAFWLFLRLVLALIIS